MIGGAMINMKKIAAAIVLAALVNGQAPAPQTPPAAPPRQAPATPAPIPMGNLNLENASLTAVIDQLARQLKLNLIVDPSVKGSITLNTYGNAASLDARNLLEMILRINGFALIQDGELYRVVPV